jgi:hypothetical protein
LEGKKTEPNRTEINRFEPVFGSVQKLKKKNRFGYLFWFKTGPNRKCSALGGGDLEQNYFPFFCSLFLTQGRVVLAFPSFSLKSKANPSITVNSAV